MIFARKVLTTFGASQQLVAGAPVVRSWLMTTCSTSTSWPELAATLWKGTFDTMAPSS